jgi:tetratricopeptide (TPR) repeat protein
VQADRSMTTSGEVLGTPAYMAPEQATLGTITERTDVYGLGATLYQLLTGRMPFSGDTPFAIVQRVIDEEPAPIGGDPDIETIVMKCLEKDPARRYESAEALALDIDRKLAGDPILAHPASTLYRLRKRAIKHKALVAAVLAGVATVIAVIAVLVPQWIAERRAKEQRQAQLEAQAAARPHLDAGRAVLHRMDALLQEPDWTPDQLVMLAEEARGEFNRALALCPEHPEALLELARVARALNCESAAIPLCDRAVASSDRFATAYLERALLKLARYEGLRHQSGGDVRAETPASLDLRRQIESDVARVREWSNDKRELALTDGLLAFADGKYEAAAQRFEEYAAARLTDPAGWEWAGHAWLHVSGGAPRAVAALTRLIKYRPRLANAWGNLGNAKIALGDSEGAVSDLTLAVELDPNLAPAFAGRGVARAELNQLDGALADFTRAIELDPKMGLVVLARARVRGRRGEFEQAVKDFSRAIELNYQPADANLERGQARRSTADESGALEDFHRAIELAPNNATAHFERGRVHETLGLLDASVADSTRAVELEPRHFLAFYNRGNVRRKLGDEDGALEDWTKAVEIAPGFGPAYLSRGTMRAQRGDRESLKDLDRAVELMPDNLQAYENRGHARQLFGDAAGAEEDFKKARP